MRVFSSVISLLGEGRGAADYLGELSDMREEVRGEGEQEYESLEDLGVEGESSRHREEEVFRLPLPPVCAFS